MQFFSVFLTAVIAQIPKQPPKFSWDTVPLFMHSGNGTGAQQEAVFLFLRLLLIYYISTYWLRHHSKTQPNILFLKVLLTKKLPNWWASSQSSRWQGSRATTPTTQQSTGAATRTPSSPFHAQSRRKWAFYAQHAPTGQPADCLPVYPPRNKVWLDVYGPPRGWSGLWRPSTPTHPSSLRRRKKNKICKRQQKQAHHTAR